MNESGRRKREWVKTAAIVFLSVMLVLTFFSSTIQNWSLPEVATQYVQSGTITAKATITGNIESVDPYEVKVTESRKVASVAVRTGSTVQKGDVLIYLEDRDSKELDEAKKALESARADYNRVILSDKYTAADISDAKKGVTAGEYRDRITRAQDTVKAAEAAVESAEKSVESAEAMVKAAEEAGNNVIESYKDELERITQSIQDYEKQIKFNTDLNTNLKKSQQWIQAEDKLDDAKADLRQASSRLETARNAYNSATAENKAQRERELRDAEAYFDSMEAAVEEAQSAYNKLAASVEQRELQNINLQNEITQLDMHKYNYQKAVDINEGSVKAETEKWQKVVDARNEDLKARKKELDEKQQELKDLISKAENVTGLQKYLDAIDEAQKKVDELTENAGGTTITAPISGTVTAVNVTAGNETSAAVPVVVMQREGQGFILKYSATDEVAKRLSVGDVGQLINSWRYNDVTVTLASIQPDPDTRGQNKLLTFNVTGTVTAGQSLSFTVGQKSANYNFIVPNSAIREDNNGKFILIVQSKGSPLGTRYTASRVDVQVIANDETQSAVSGALSGYEFVITTSTKPVEAGNLVRLPD